jgi:hypothetical protein
MTCSRPFRTLYYPAQEGRDQRPCPRWEKVLLYAKQVTACNLQFFVPYPGSIGLDYAQIILAQVNDF